MTTIPEPIASASKPTELRLALAIRGGVSLAVWMGGACSEIATLRASAPPDESGAAAPTVSTTYARLLQLAGYDTVTVDVIAGTSAGGLNGVLLSQHLVCGAEFGGSLRDLWLTIGDLAELTRNASFEPAPSLLKGTEGFYDKVKQAMERLAPEQPDVSDTPLRLLVTATRLHPRDDALFPTTGYPVPAGRARAFFRFRHQGTEYAEFSDFVDPKSRDRLAFAARTTSSFPAAFEPARTQVVAGRAPSDSVDMRGVSSETGVPDKDDPTCVQLMDGGVLNNIPIGWAVRTIAGMPADTPVDRWLVFLQPVSDDRAAPSRAKDASGGAPPSPARVVSLLRSMLSVKLGSESVLDGLQDLRSLVAESVQLDAVLEATAGTQLTEQDTEVVGRAVATYREATGLAEVSRLRGLLTDPLTTIAGDPLPIPAETFPLSGTVRSSGGDEVDALRMPAHLEDVVLPDGTALADVGRAARAPSVAARVVTMLLYVARAREAELGRVFGAVRGDLYGLRLAIETITAIRDRIVLRWATERPTLTGKDLLQAADAEVASILRAAVDANPAPATGESAGATWRARAAAMAGAYASAPAPAEPTVGSWPQTPYASLWDALVDAAVVVDDVLAEHHARPDQRIGDGTGRDATARTLAAIEVLTGAMRPDPLAGASNIKLAVCSASNVSPIENQILAAEPTSETRIDLKLSGNQISNFAAFLSARWRLNDWIWGRMDGAQTLVNVVAGQDRLAGITSGQLEALFTARPDLPAAAADELVATLERRWQLYKERAESDPAAIARDAITERLQWEILAEELPLLEQLETRPAGHDRPPSTKELDDMISAATGAGTQPRTRLGAGQLKRLGGVGDESVFNLFPRSDLRRTLTRLGFVAWSALLPGGKIGKAIQVVVAWTFAPFLLAVLVALVAPLSTMLAAVAIWIAIAAATHVWASGTSIPIALSFILAATMLTLQHWVPRARRKKRDGAGWLTGSAWTAPLAVAFAASGVSAVACLIFWGWHESVLDDHGHARAVGLFAGLAVLMPLVYIATGTGAVGLVQLLRRSPRVLLKALKWTAAVAVIAAAVGFLAAYVAHELSGGAAGFMVMYVSLLATLGGLFILFGGLRPYLGALGRALTRR